MESKSSFQKILNTNKPHLYALLLFLGVSLVYFYPQLQGEVINQDDIAAGIGMTKEIKDYEAKTGKTSLWTDAMFGGMPTYQISSPQKSNLIRRFVEPFFQLKISHPISWFFVSAVCAYILLIVMGLESWLAITGALMFSFTTNQLLLYEAGHTAKFRAISYLPLILAGMYLLLEKRKWLAGSSVFLLGTALNISANHYQMTFYFAIGMVVFMAVYLIYAAREGALMNYLKAAAIMLVCGVLAVGPSASKILTTNEYAKETMRGTSQLKAEAAERTDGAVNKDGLRWDYAMMWSNAPRDLLALFIPGAVGGSSGEPVGESYETAKLMGARGDRKVPSPLYWGGAESVSGPIYYGALVFFLFVLGMLSIRTTRLKAAFLGAFVVIALISLGKYFEGFQRLFFDHFPKYNNFRAHNSAMGVAAILVPAMAFLGLQAFFNLDDKKQQRKNLLMAIYLVGGVILLILLLGASLFGFEHFQDGRFMQLVGGDQQAFDRFMEALVDDRKKMMRLSAVRSLVFVGAGAGLLWFWQSGKLKKQQAIMAICVLAAIDLFSVDWKYVNHDDFEKKNVVTNQYRPRPVDEQIMQMEPKGRGYYRVFDISKDVNTFSSSFGSYFYNTVGGYSAVKLQRIQDVIDTIFRERVNVDVANMLNTKYFIVGEQPQLQMNPGALGNAWFIDTIRMVESATDELYALKNFSADREAIIHKEWSDYLNGFNPAVDSNSKGAIELIEYAPDRLVYRFNSDKEQLVMFSEIWYGPNLGWQAYIDGEPVDHIRANYLLRAMRVPAGNREIIFEFKPETYERGEKISLASSSIILIWVLGWVGLSIRRLFQK